MPVDTRRLGQLAARQDGAVTREQLLALGATSDWISRQVRTLRFQRPFLGVYVTYTGPMRWRTRARAALLYCGPGAVLSHTSAAYHHHLYPSADTSIHVSVPAQRKPAPQAGLVVHRRRRVPDSWGNLRATSPEATLVDLASASTTSVDDLISMTHAVMDAGGSRADVLAELAGRTRVRRRRLLLDMVAEVNAGIESPMEYRYRHGVERAHGLPSADLQVREVIEGSHIRADVRYRRYRLRVELDGQLAHPNGTTDADVWRDNAVLVADEETTLRYRWRHVTVHRCRTAAQVATALRARGWDGTPRRCGPGCTVGQGWAGRAGSRV